MSRRVKISFETINENNYTIVDPNEVYASSNRMKINMVAKVRDYKKKEAQSIKDAALLVLTR